MTEALLSALRGRLAEVEVERERVSQELGRLEAEAAALSDESLHLRALIERHESQPATPVEVPAQQADPGAGDAAPDKIEPLPAATPGGLVAGEPAGNRWLLSAVEVLSKADGPVHYRDLYKRMKALGAPSFGGQNPVATFLAAMSREAGRPGSSVQRVGRGEYALTNPEAGTKPVKPGKKRAGSAA